MLIAVALAQPRREGDGFRVYGQNHETSFCKCSRIGSGKGRNQERSAEEIHGQEWFRFPFDIRASARRRCSLPSR
jgi:hypothetical protein